MRSLDELLAIKPSSVKFFSENEEFKIEFKRDDLSWGLGFLICIIFTMLYLLFLKSGPMWLEVFLAVVLCFLYYIFIKECWYQLDGFTRLTFLRKVMRVEEFIGNKKISSKDIALERVMRVQCLVNSTNVKKNETIRDVNPIDFFHQNSRYGSAWLVLSNEHIHDYSKFYSECSYQNIMKMGSEKVAWIAEYLSCILNKPTEIALVVPKGD